MELTLRFARCSLLSCALAVQIFEPAWSPLQTAMERMHAAMASVRPSASADVDFARLMLPHHQAAIDMAKTELTFGSDPQLRRLAQEIVADQQSEIQVMQLWLKRR